MARDKLTPKRQDAIAELIADGVPAMYACQSAGISTATFYRWLALGREGSERHARFLAAIEEALARSVATLVLQISEAARTDWRAAAWLLTRRAPQDFIDPAKRHDLVADEAKARVIVTEAEERLQYLETRRQIRQEMDDDGRES
jgi:hypothetical protein